MNIRRMSLNDLKASLKGAKRMGNLSLIEMLEDQIDQVSDHSSYNAPQRGGKREFVEDMS